MKRVLALILALTLTLCVVPVIAEAAPAAKPLVVVLPGIMGSELKEYDAFIWPPFEFGFLDREGFAALSDETKDDLRFNPMILGVVAKAVENLEKLKFTDGKSLPGITAVQNYGVMEMYKPLVETLRQSYDTVMFAYDWRQSNAKSAEQLAAFLRQYAQREIVIVAHSMGGLVAAEYIAASAPSNVRKVVTLGTPYLGSSKVTENAGQMIAGDNKDAAELVNFLIGDRLSALMNSLPSVKELEPRARYSVPTSSGTEWYAIYGTASGGTSDGTVAAASATNDFRLPNFAVNSWHTGLITNWDALDAILNAIEKGALTSGSDSIAALPSVSKLYADLGGETVEHSLELFNIKGANYVKLRDVAKMLENKFEVAYYSDPPTIILTPGMTYTPIGGELAAASVTDSRTAYQTNDLVFTSSFERLYLGGYKIDGSNYVKLRDIAAALDFGVLYNAETKSITLVKNSGYDRGA
ncbi:MAG: alpha/beta hydrolase [Oscillospiraceae bacterium]|jgi:pimeloyl-ACP methyl ester carboxylesterase|nr:alpha/beta hydrolase [Oscillospiraceae bacterium]